MLPVGEIVHFIGDGAAPWSCLPAMVMFCRDDTSADLSVFGLCDLLAVPPDDERGNGTYHRQHVRGDSPLDNPPA